MEQREINPKTVKTLFIAICIIIASILLIISLQRIFRGNPYGSQIKIDNFDKYFPDAPQDNKDLAFSNLYNAVVSSGIDEANIPKSGAIIRNDSANYDYNSAERYYNDTAIIDIPAIQQSYRLTLIWSSEKDNEATVSAFPSQITCLKSDETIYPDFGCNTFLQTEEDRVESLDKKYPLLTKLPIRVEYYVDGYGAHVKYNIYSHLTGEGENESFSVLIEDYTGGNYEPALERIRNLGFNPDYYEIEYKDLSEEYSTPIYTGAGS